MSLAAALLLALVSPLSAAVSDQSFAVPGFSVSLGPGRRVTGRLTYDARKAAGGGFILAAPRAGAEQAAAVRLSRGLVAASGGLFSPASSAARRHGTAAIVVSAARWENGALVVDRPVFGAAHEVGGVKLEPVERVEPKPLAEGEVVAIDASRGLLILPAAADQEDELALDEALSAFEGLADAQALVQWWRGRADSPRAEQLAARLADELARRVASGLARGDGAARVLSSVRESAPKTSRASVEAAIARAVQGALRDGAARVRELEPAAREAASPAAADRIADEAQAAARRLAQLSAAAPGRADASSARSAAAAVSAAAKKRAAELAKKPALTLEEALAAAGARAPRGTTLGPDVYRAFMSETGLQPLVDEVAGDASLDLRRKGERLAALFAAAKPSADGAAAKAVAAAAPREGEVAVSGVAGREVVPAARALDGAKLAWAGWWSGYELGRRKRAGGGAPEPTIRLEPVVPADASGEAFSRDPATGRPDRIVISAGADEYVLDRAGSRELMPPLISGEKRALTSEQLKRVTRAARAAESWLGAPAKLAFSFTGGELQALSAEPMDARRPEPAEAGKALDAAPSQALDVKDVR